MMHIKSPFCTRTSLSRYMIVLHVNCQDVWCFPLHFNVLLIHNIHVVTLSANFEQNNLLTQAETHNMTGVKV